MKNIFNNLSDQTKGVILIVIGSLLVLNYFGIIEILNSAFAIVGLLMIIGGVMLGKFHKKVYLLLKKSTGTASDDEPMDPDQQSF